MTNEEALKRIQHKLDLAVDDPLIMTDKEYEIFSLCAKALEQQSTLDKIRAEILEEKEWAYADFDQYKIDYLGVDAEYVEDELPQDDFRYGMERCVEIIDKYKTESGKTKQGLAYADQDTMMSAT